MRLTSVAIALLMTAVAFAGCADDDDGSAAEIVPLSCSNLNALSHYQYHIGVQLEPPQEPTPSLDGVDQREALEMAIAGELSTFDVNGRVVQPDRTQEILGYNGGQIDTRRIGDRSWVRVGEEFVEEEPPEGSLPSAAEICDVTLSVLEGAKTSVEPDSTFVLDSDAQHYHLNLTDGEDLEPLFGDHSFGDYVVDVWLAKDGRIPAQIVIQSNNGEASGEQAYRMSLEVTKANDISLRVDQPN